MQDEVARIIKATGQTIVSITHSVDEAITLGDRIIVITDRPGRVKEILPVAIPRPRSGRAIRHLSEYVELRDRVWSLLAKEPQPAQERSPVENLT